MSVPTASLDELLERAGVTYEEWQRARVVVEDYWKDYAQLSGWVPAKSSSRPVLRLPLGEGAEFSVTGLLTPAQWSILVDVLAACRRGLVVESNPEAGNSQ